MAEHLRHFLSYFKHIPVKALQAGVYITSPGRLNFFKAAPNICVSSVHNLPHIVFVAPLILKWQLDFLKMCPPLLKKNNRLISNPHSSPKDIACPSLLVIVRR
jgi:hypothetical protein